MDATLSTATQVRVSAGQANVSLVHWNRAKQLKFEQDRMNERR